MDLKGIFGDKALTYDELEKALNEKGVKLADLAEGNYVSREKLERLEGNYKKQLDAKAKELEDAKSQALAEYQSKGADADKLQAQVEALTKQKAELEGKQKETAGQLDRLTKRELAVSKTGIHDPDFLDLMQARFGSQELGEYEKSVTEYATANKAKWGVVKPSPDLSGEPRGSGEEVSPAAKAALEYAHLNYDKKG